MSLLSATTADAARERIAAGRDPNEILHCAVYDDSVDVDRVLLDAGADANGRATGLVLTPLHLARSVLVAGLLLAAGADVNARTTTGCLPFDCAMRGVRPNVARALLAAGTDVSAVRPSSLHIALRYMWCDLALAILNAGVRFDSQALFWVVRLCE